MKFQDRLQRDMTAEIELDETPSSIAKELFELGLIHQVSIFICRNKARCLENIF